MDAPLYILDIDENGDLSGVDAVGLVDRPAIDRQWMAFNSQQMKFQVIDESKQILAGALMVADLPIYRQDETGKEFYVTFPAKTIFKIVEKIKKNGTQLKFNLDHNPNNKVQAYLLSDFIINSEMGIKTPEGHKELTEGSWFGLVKIPNKEQYEAIKNGKQGFSVEGYFNEIKIGDKPKEQIEKLIQKINMKNELKTLFGTMAKLMGFEEEEKEEEVVEVKMETATLEDGTTIEWEGALEVGTAIMVQVEEGEPIQAPDGTHTLSTGVVIVTENGIVTSIEDAAAEEVVEVVSPEVVEELLSEIKEFKSQVAKLQGQIKNQETFNKQIFESLKFLAEEKDAKKDTFNRQSKAVDAYEGNAAAMFKKLSNKN